MSALQRIVQSGVVPIVRAPTQEAALRICQVLIEAGMGAVEVTFTVPRAPEVIARLRDSHSHALVGAGTVLDASAARAAVDAGAEFLVSVVVPPDVMAAGREHGVPVIPGAFTPSEITAALAQGAEVIKLFPASVGGPAYLRALLEPLPSLRAIPTGGVSAANVREWFAAGALPVGVGSALLRDVAVTRDYAGLRQRAEELLAAARSARGRAEAG